SGAPVKQRTLAAHPHSLREPSRSSVLSALHLGDHPSRRQLYRSGACAWRSRRRPDPGHRKIASTNQEMQTEFRKAMLPDDLRSLVAFDRRLFPSDYFSGAQWKHFNAYWMLIDGKRVGCCAFWEHVDFQED